MAELTIAVRVHNGADSIADVIDSALRQEDVDCELVMIDDGSTDTSASIIRSWQDPRVTFMQTGSEHTAGYCYNLALARSQAPCFATLHADCYVQPGAFRKLVDACQNSPDIAMAHGNFFLIDADNHATRDHFRAQMNFFRQIFTAKDPYSHLLLRRGNHAPDLRVYKRTALLAVGRFDEHPRVDADFDMALRIAGRFSVKMIADFCYSRPSQSESKIRWRRLSAWYHRAMHCRRLASRISFLHDRSTVRSLLLKDFCDQSGLARVKRKISGRLQGWYWRSRIALEARGYDLLVAGIARRSFSSSSTANPTSNGHNNRRIAYYTWHFPVLSQTFINRELAALKQAGVDVTIFADEAEEIALADDNAQSVLTQTQYLEPIDSHRLRRYHRHFFRSSPLEYLKSFCFVISRPYGSYKNIYEDLSVFSRAVYLAGLVLDRKIDHLHAPWSDRCAFVAMLAARLAGITYSVQARAHDIHRDGYLFALADKFEPAQFIVTNTRYNEAHMKTFLRSAHWPKLFVIHNGLDLHRFVPTIKPHGSDSSPKLLCVARLIEQKGLIYLLQACANLRDQGYDFDCEIVGGTEDIFMNYYLDVKRLHRQLGLEGQVRFTGSLPFSAVLEKYARADIFVLPCVIAADGSRDITPNALIEAMAMKLPVISTTVTGVPEIVEHGVSGILVPPKDASALSHALENLIRDTHLRKRLGKHARKRVEEKFDINRNVSHYIKLFSARNGAL